MRKHNCVTSGRVVPTPVIQSGMAKPVIDPKLAEALSLMRGIIRSPLGSNPDTDKKIKRAWESGS